MVVRGGLGRYYDFAYTNANILFAVIGAQSSFGTIYEVTNSTGIRNADGSFYQVGQPLPPNQLAERHRAPSEPCRKPSAEAALHGSGELRHLEEARQGLRGGDRRRLRVTARTLEPVSR
jgi:hypothetical protein